MPNLTYPGSDTIHRHVLPNGLVVLAYENFASQSVIINGLVRAGAIVESPDMAGLASFTADLLLRGTQARDFAQIYESLESVGASLDVSAGRHVTEFSAHCLVEDVDLILELLTQSLRTPTFPASQVELVRGQILTDLQIQANDTRRRASRAFYEQAYPNHPYSQATIGYLPTVTAVTRDQIAQFHADYFGPTGAIICVVGAIRADEVLNRITAVFGDWGHDGQRPLPFPPDAPRPDGIIRTHIPLPDKSQADLILGLPGPRRSAPDYLDARVMNTILGVFGMMGRIGETVREKQGLAYYAYSTLGGGIGPSPWSASAGVAPENIDRAIQSILAEIRRIQDTPVPADELADSIAYLTGSMPVSLETNSGLAGVITDIEFYQLGLNYLQHYPDHIRNMTPAHIQAAAQKYLSTESLVIAVSGPGSHSGHI